MQIFSIGGYMLVVYSYGFGSLARLCKLSVYTKTLTKYIDFREIIFSIPLIYCSEINIDFKRFL